MARFGSPAPQPAGDTGLLDAQFRRLGPLGPALGLTLTYQGFGGTPDRRTLRWGYEVAAGV